MLYIKNKTRLWCLSLRVCCKNIKYTVEFSVPYSYIIHDTVQNMKQLNEKCFDELLAKWC